MKNKADIEKILIQHFESLPPENHSDETIKNSINLLIEKKESYERKFVAKDSLIANFIFSSKRFFQNIYEYMKYYSIWILRPQPALATFIFIIVITSSILWLNKWNHVSNKVTIPAITKNDIKPIQNNNSYDKVQNNNGKDFAVVTDVELTKINSKEYDVINLYTKLRGNHQSENKYNAEGQVNLDSLVSKVFYEIKGVLELYSTNSREFKNNITTLWEYSASKNEDKTFKTRLIFEQDSSDTKGRIIVKYQKYLSNEKRKTSTSIDEIEKKYDAIYDDVKTKIRLKIENSR
jgi:hypothetical protein